MKTITSIVLMTLCISFYANAQINKVAKKSNLSVKPKTTLKLPLLKAKKGSKITEFDLDNIKKFTVPKVLNTVTIEPKPFSTLSYALNVTLTSKKLSTTNASLFFNGRYYNNSITVNSMNSGRIGMTIKGKPYKTYRVKLKFRLYFDSRTCNNLNNVISMSGGSSHSAKIKNGLNSIEFLIQNAEFGEIYLNLMRSDGLVCKNEIFKGDRVKMRFESVQIRELQD